MILWIKSQRWSKSKLSIESPPVKKHMATAPQNRNSDIVETECDGFFRKKNKKNYDGLRLAEPNSIKMFESARR